jgi:hypothetical protein
VTVTGAGVAVTVRVTVDGVAVTVTGAGTRDRLNRVLLGGRPADGNRGDQRDDRRDDGDDLAAVGILGRAGGGRLRRCRVLHSPWGGAHDRTFAMDVGGPSK